MSCRTEADYLAAGEIPPLDSDFRKRALENEMESLSGPIKVFYRQNRISKSTKSPQFWINFNILFQKKRVEDPNRVLLYIREADTEVYDALMLESPDLNGLTKAVSEILLENDHFRNGKSDFWPLNNLFDPKMTIFDRRAQKLAFWYKVKYMFVKY